MQEYDSAKLDWMPQGSAMPSLIEHWRRQRTQVAQVASNFSLNLADSLHLSDQVAPHREVAAVPGAVRLYPDVLVQAAVVRLGDQTTDGQIVEGVLVPWFEIVMQLERDPDFLFKIPWRKMEELIAGAYERAGWSDVILTPRSGDGGRDVIATRPGAVSVRIVDQIKAYKPGHLVTADEVRSMLGVLQVNQNVSKGLVTTTSQFAPGIQNDSGIQAFMPYRLDLVDGGQLKRWLSGLASK